MLYDTRKAGIYSVENFTKWLGDQPAGKTYDYCKPEDCAAAQYLKAHGIAQYSLSPDDLKAMGWHEIVFNPWAETFGAAHRRARILALSGWRLWIARHFGIIRPVRA